MARKSSYDEELDQVIARVTQAKRDASQREQSIRRQISRLTMQIEQLEEEEGLMREMLADGPAEGGGPPKTPAGVPEDPPATPPPQGQPAASAEPAGKNPGPAASVAAAAPAEARTASPAAGAPGASPAGTAPAAATPAGAAVAVQALPAAAPGEVPDDDGDELEFKEAGKDGPGTLPGPAKAQPPQ